MFFRIRNASLETALSTVNPTFSLETSLIAAWFFMRFARFANLRVLCVSSLLSSAPVTVQMMVIFALPPRLGWSNRVSFESR